MQSHQRTFRNFGLNHRPPPGTPKTRRQDWQLHALRIKRWFQEEKSTKLVAELLSEQGFEVSEHQVNRYKRSQGLCTPNIRTTRRIPGFVDPRPELTRLDLTGRDLTSNASYASSSYDDMEAIESLPNDAELTSSEADGSADYEAVSEASSTLHSDRDLQETRNDVSSLGWAELSTNRLTENFQAIRISPEQGRTSPTKYFTAIGTFDMDATISTSATASPLIGPRCNGQRPESDSMSISRISNVSSIHTNFRPSDALSSRSSVTTRRQTSVRSNAPGRWVSLDDAAKRLSMLRVGRVLDVHDRSDDAEEAESVTVDVARRSKPTRRLIIVHTGQDVYYGVPVRTYKAKGVSGMSDPKIEAHAILHVAGTDPVATSNEPDLTKRPIVVESRSVRMKLSSASRVNFSRTCEFKPPCEVRKVAMVEPGSMPYFTNYWCMHRYKE